MRQVMRSGEFERQQLERVSYVGQLAPWHASHALRREYVMVLHSHKSFF
jgi:hypothetical protein